MELVESLVYDSQGRLEKLDHRSSGGSTARSFAYTYDKVGNITEIERDDGVTWSYEYDNRYRLTEASRDTGFITVDFLYSYDDGDNLTSKERVGSWTRSFSHNDADDCEIIELSEVFCSQGNKGGAVRWEVLLSF